VNRILIVEDDEAIAQLESDYLHAQGFEATVAPDGPTGLDKALTGDYALIILDVMLPGMDGFEVLSKVREQRNIPILLVTARKDDVDKIKGLGLGADDYITKPFSPSELAARVKAHIKRYDRLVGAVVPERDVIEIRDLKLDKTSRKLYVSGEEKKLTAREFDLLEFLMTHPNKVYSKQELFEQIWNSDSIGDIATVTVHIKKLREKIEVDRNNPQYIETVWGVGYRFRV